ncbi:uncharacterized protein LOC111119103 [Crassostrea virginica]
MALGETFSNSSIFLKICIVLMPLQTLLYVTGFSTEYWVHKTVSSVNNSGNVYEGLWKVQSCFMNQCVTADIQNVEDWLHETRFFATIGLIGFLVMTAVHIKFIYLFASIKSSKSYEYHLAFVLCSLTYILITVAAAVTAACVLVAVIMYGIHYSDPDGSLLVSDSALYWSFGLCVTALVLDLIFIILLVLHFLFPHKSLSIKPFQ